MEEDNRTVKVSCVVCGDEFNIPIDEYDEDTDEICDDCAAELPEEEEDEEAAEEED